MQRTFSKQSGDQIGPKGRRGRGCGTEDCTLLWLAALAGTEQSGGKKITLNFKEFKQNWQI